MKPLQYQNTSGRIKELDGLRGIAILMIIFFHYGSVQLIANTSKIGTIIERITYFGWIGVDLFFVLSGFLICSILLKNKNSTNFFSTFYIRRVLRIVPNYFLLLLLYILLLNLPFFYNCKFLNEDQVIPIWSYFAMVHNFYMAYQNSLGNDSISITWSVGIEEQFYLFFPFIVLYLKKYWLVVFLVIAIISAYVIRSRYNEWIPAYVLLQCRMDAIFFGALIAFFNHYYNLKRIVNKYFVVLLIIMIADIIICTMLYYSFGNLGAIKNTLFSIFFSGLLLLALTKQSSVLAKCLRSKVLMWIGKISYSLYLFHFIILGVFHFIFSGREDIGISNQRDVVITFLALITSFLFSYLLNKFWEMPAILLGKKFKYNVSVTGTAQILERRKIYS